MTAHPERMRIDRRRLLACGGAALLMPASSVLAQNLPPLGTPTMQRLFYDITWTGIPVGEHEVTITDDGKDGDFTVQNRVEIVVSLLLFDAIRFEHTSTEVRRAGRLQSYESHTLDDGEYDLVSGTLTDDGLVLV